MAEEKEQIMTEEQTTVAPEEKAAPVTQKDVFIENMRKKHPDVEDEDELYRLAMEGYDSDHEFSKKQKKANGEFAEIVGKYPEVADFFRKTVETGDPGVAMYYMSDLYKAYMNGDIDSEEFKKLRDEQAKTDAEKKDALKKQEETYLAWCKKRGYDPEEWIQKANDTYFTKMAGNAMDDDAWDAIDHGMNYANDVEAAETRGRNANIVAQRKDLSKVKGDGVPTGGGANIPQRDKQEESRFGRIAQARKQNRDL